MHDTEVNPPAGGRVGDGGDQPATGTTGVGTVVGTADGSVELGEVVVVVVVDGATRRTARTSCVGAQAVVTRATAARTPATRAAVAAAPCPTRRACATCPPSGIAWFRPVRLVVPGGRARVGPGQVGAPSESSARNTMPVRGLGWKKVLFGGMRRRAWAQASIWATGTGGRRTAAWAS